MDQTDYKELYKQAKERAKHNLTYAQVEEIFPEPESEDERIRKDLIIYLRSILANKKYGDKFIESWIDWLEKQGEKTSDKIVEKARTEKQRVLLTETDGSANIDWDCRSLDDVKTLLKCGLEFIRTIEADKQILTDSRFGGCSIHVPTRYDKGIKQGEQILANSAKNCKDEQKPIKEHNVCDFCEDRYGCVNPCPTKLIEEQDPDWSEEDKNMIRFIGNAITATDSAEYLKSKHIGIIDAHIWLENLKDRVQPKQEWSEEDENHVKSILSTIECCKAQFPNAQAVVEAYNADIEWLKSLRTQNTCKPSDLPHWKKSTLPNDNTTGFNSDYFCHKGYCINYKELFEKLPKDD